MLVVHSCVTAALALESGALADMFCVNCCIKNLCPGDVSENSTVVSLVTNSVSTVILYTAYYDRLSQIASSLQPSTVTASFTHNPVDIPDTSSVKPTPSPTGINQREAKVIRVVRFRDNGERLPVYPGTECQYTVSRSSHVSVFCRPRAVPTSAGAQGTQTSCPSASNEPSQSKSTNSGTAGTTATPAPQPGLTESEILALIEGIEDFCRNLESLKEQIETTLDSEYSATPSKAFVLNDLLQRLDNIGFKLESCKAGYAELNALPKNTVFFAEFYADCQQTLIKRLTRLEEEAKKVQLQLQETEFQFYSGINECKKIVAQIICRAVWHKSLFE